MKNLDVLVAPILQMSICFCIWGYKCRRGNAKHILCELFVVEQLRPGNAHQLQADTHETHVVDVWSNVRARPGKPHPSLVAVGLSKNASTHVLREVIAHDELAANN